MRATFKVKNVGGQPLTIECLVAATRLGSWTGTAADFPRMTNLTLQPGQEVTYSSTRSFTTAGTYYSEPRAKINGSWNIVPGGLRTSLSVSSG